MLCSDYLCSNIVIYTSFSDLTYFWEVGQKYCNILFHLFVQMKTSKSNSEINWPLATICSMFLWWFCETNRNRSKSEGCKKTEWTACVLLNFGANNLWCSLSFMAKSHDIFMSLFLHVNIFAHQSECHYFIFFQEISMWKNINTTNEKVKPSLHMIFF